MGSITRASALLVPLLLIACKKDEVGPGACPTGTALLDEVCRKTCSADADCLLDEFCDAGPGACMPEPITDTPKIKVFEVAPVPVALNDSVGVDFGVVSSDHLRIEVLWMDNSTTLLLDTSNEYFGTKRVENVTQNGIVRLTASKNGMTQEQTRPIEVDDGTPRLVKFGVDPSRVVAGTEVTISWQVENQSAPIEIGVEGGGILVSDAPAQGERMETVFETTTFTLVSGELSARATVDVVAPQEPEIVVFEQRGPNPAPSRHPITFVWETRNAIDLTFEVDENAVFTVRSPVEVDRGAVAGVFPSGSHRVRVVATGLLQQKVVSQEIEIYSVSNQPPSIAQFEHPAFIDTNSGSDVTVSWTIDAPDPIATQAFFNWSDLQVGAVGLQDQATHPQANGTVGAALRAFSPAGAVDARAIILAVIPEQEPNNEQTSAQPIRSGAVDGETNALDPDFFALGEVDLEQTIVAQMYGSCPLGISLSVTDELGNGMTYIASADGDCPALIVPGQSGDRWLAAVGNSLTDAQVPYRLAVEIRDPFCGDGSMNRQEQCDDGNLNNDDGCSADCLFEDVVFYGLGAGVPEVEVRPPNARPVQFHPYPGGANLPEDNGFGFAEIPSGFAFFERTYWAAIVHADGSISFTTEMFGGSFDPTRPLDFGGPEDVIAAAGADLRRAGPGSGVYAWVTGSGGLAIEYESFVLVGHPNSRLDFRIVLEVNGDITIGYAQVSGLGPTAEFQAGLQDRRGARVFNLPGCDPTCSAETAGSLEGQIFQIISGS